MFQIACTLGNSWGVAKHTPARLKVDSEASLDDFDNTQ